MNLLDQFTSIQLDRDDDDNRQLETREEAIEEESGSVAASDKLKDEDGRDSEDGDSDGDLLIPATTKDAPPQYEPVDPAPTLPELLSKSASPPHLSEVAEPTATKNDIPKISPSPELAVQQEELPVPPATDFSKYHELYTLESSVQQPIKDMDSLLKPFMNYLIVTKTNNPLVLKLNHLPVPEESDGNQVPDVVELSTRRRYGDFRYLHDSLSKDYPTLVIPPLPLKLNLKYLTGDTFSNAFIKKRLHLLNTFIRFITNHKILSQLSVFHLFILDLSDWNTFTKLLKLKDVEEQLGFGRMNEELADTFMNFMTPSKYKQENNKEILDISEKLKRLYENLVRLNRLFTKLNKKHNDLSFDYSQFSKQINKLSQVAASLDSNGAGTAAADLAMVNNFQVFAEALEYFADLWKNLHAYFDELFLVSLKNCAKYIVSLTNLINLQHNKRIDLQVLQDYHNKAQAELIAMGGTTSAASGAQGYQSQGLVGNTAQLIRDTLSTLALGLIGLALTDNKMAKVQSRINQLQHEIDIQTKLVNELTNNIVCEEYPNWDRFNKNEVKEAMVGMCDQQILFYQGLIDNWTDAEFKLLKRLDELN